MNEQRTKFLREFAIKKNLKDSDIDQALIGKRNIPGVVSIPKGLKREHDSEDDTEALEEKTKDKKKNKK